VTWRGKEFFPINARGLRDMFERAPLERVAIVLSGQRSTMTFGCCAMPKDERITFAVIDQIEHRTLQRPRATDRGISLECHDRLGFTFCLMPLACRPQGYLRCSYGAVVRVCSA
jgi:hypothetical protein